MNEERMSGLYFICGITMLVIVSCITFVAHGVKQREQELRDYYASPHTQEQIDESWQKFERREKARQENMKKIKDSVDKGR